jgi:hypothetical protein
MSLYSLAQRTSNTTINNAMLEIIAVSTLAPKIMEIGFTITTATSIAVGLGRPAAIGVTPGTISTFQAEQNTTDPTAKTTCALTWGTSPTNPTNYLRRFFTPATIGAGVIWTFPRGLYIPPTGTNTVTLSNITAGAVSDVWIVIDE